MCKKDRGNIIDDKKQKMKDYQKEYRKNIKNKQKQKYQKYPLRFKKNKISYYFVKIVFLGRFEMLIKLVIFAKNAIIQF